MLREYIVPDHENKQEIKIMRKPIWVLVIALFTVPAVADNPFSIEVLAGSAKQKSSLVVENVTDWASDDDFSVGVRGAFHVGRHLALELSYHDYGELDKSFSYNNGDDSLSVKVGSTAFNAGIRGDVPLGNGFSLNGRVGVALWNVDARADVGSAGDSVWLTLDEDGRNIYYGAGVQYVINPHLVVGVEYTITVMDKDISLGGLSLEFEHEVKNLSLSIGYRF